MIPLCTDDLVGGCLNPNENNVNQIQDKLVELLRGVTASGVMARRIVLFGMGKETSVQTLEKSTSTIEVKVRLEFGKEYWVTILSITIICTVFLAWLFYQNTGFPYKIYQLLDEVEED